MGCKAVYFNINEYAGKYAMHCKTIIEAKDFCKHLHMLGRKWRDGEESYLDYTYFDSYFSNTVYYFNEGVYGTVDCAKGNNYIVLEWSDFMNKKFTKADLKTGDVILRRSGDTEILMRELNTFITKTGWNDLADIKDDLTNATYGGWSDIVAVRRPIHKADCVFHAFAHKLGVLIYERKEVEEMTLEEVCKALGKEVKIVKEKNK